MGRLPEMGGLVTLETSSRGVLPLCGGHICAVLGERKPRFWGKWQHSARGVQAGTFEEGGWRLTQAKGRWHLSIQEQA